MPDPNETLLADAPSAPADAPAAIIPVAERPPMELPTSLVTPDLVPAVATPARPIRLKYEYGMEVTFIGNPTKVLKQGEATIMRAFPLENDAETLADREEKLRKKLEAENVPPEKVEEIIEQQADPVLKKLMGLQYPELKQRFLDKGLGETFAENQAKRLLKEIVLFDLGLITSIDPYGSSGNTTSNAAVVRKQVIIDEAPAAIRTRNSRGRVAQVDDETPQSVSADALSMRIINSILQKWKKVGYRDRIGKVGVQWNGDREVEVTSPVNRTLLQCETFYEAARYGFHEVLGLPMETSTDSGGGGHLHVTKNGGGNLDEMTMHNLFWDLVTRPYITWAFNDPNDMTQARAPIEHISSMMVGKTPYNTDKGASVRWAVPRSRMAHPDEDGFAHGRNNASTGNYTTEFRLFQMPKDWQEQKAHIMFVEAWAGAASQRGYFDTLEGLRPWRKGKAIGWTSAKAMEAFKWFIVGLGLDWSDYEAMCGTNILTKFAHYHNELT